MTGGACKSDRSSACTLHAHGPKIVIEQRDRISESFASNSRSTRLQDAKARDTSLARRERGGTWEKRKRTGMDQVPGHFQFNSPSVASDRTVNLHHSQRYCPPSQFIKFRCSKHSQRLS